MIDAEFFEAMAVLDGAPPRRGAGADPMAGRAPRKPRPSDSPAAILYPGEGRPDRKRPTAPRGNRQHNVLATVRSIVRQDLGITLNSEQIAYFRNALKHHGEHTHQYETLVADIRELMSNMPRGSGRAQGGATRADRRRQGP